LPASWGAVDLAVRGFFDRLYASNDDLKRDVRVHIAISALLASTPLRTKALAEQAQCSDGEAEDALRSLVAAGAVERLLDRSRSYRLTGDARRALAGRMSYRQRTSLDDAWESINAYLDVHPDIGGSDAMELLGVTGEQASRILSRLRNERAALQLVGQARGRGVRYRRR
jgi:DNA-binding MarR family transcriptional regulator